MSSHNKEQRFGAWTIVVLLVAAVIVASVWERIWFFRARSSLSKSRENQWSQSFRKGAIETGMARDKPNQQKRSTRDNQVGI